MMNLKSFSLVTMMIITSISSVNSQKTANLFMPKEIRQAYKKGTRSFDGKAGENYFINRIDYSIKAEFDPKTRKLSGQEIITYTNNSPDSLSNIYFNLYQDIFKKGNSRDWDIGSVDIHDGVLISKIIYNAEEIDVNSPNVSNRSSMLRIKLPAAIAAGKEAIIEIHWSFTLPGTVPIRMGTYGDKNFFLAYWFPKVAVYDDIVGWNTQGHSGSQEFYNDFGDYEVEISVAGEYNVWSTGILQNADELFTKQYFKKIEKSKKADEIIHIISKEDRNKGNILKDSDKHIWKFISDNTPDFAFAVSKTYLWDATSINSGDQRISVNSIYPEKTNYFHEVAEISKNVISFFTNDIPAIPYPYPQLTAFSNGKTDGGMEFPGMINDGDVNNKIRVLGLTAHEIGHSYFPFYTGLNEQKYAWMDEGMITFFPQFFVEKYSDEKDFLFFKRNIATYNKYAGTFNDVPLMISSNNVGRFALRFHAYNRPSVAFYLLYNYLGKEKFVKGLQLFTERWNGKHPTPYDFFFTFNEIAGEDLAWFWKTWFFEIGYADLAISRIDYTDNMKVIVNIENKTGFPVPVYLTAVYKDGKTKNFSYDMKIWAKGEKIFTISVPDRHLEKVFLDTETTPDAYPKDNEKKI